LRGVRVQLVRRRDASRGVKVYLADERGLYAMTLERSEDLLALELDAWSRGGVAPGARETEPLYLVCVHGKRDRCCALLGLPVYRALSEQVGERAMETTHLGGHRFAATLLVLPSGLCYGRMSPAQVPGLIEATARDEWFELDYARGRTAYGPEAQAAEIALRRATGVMAIDAYRLDGVDKKEGGFEVRFGSHVVALEREAMPAMATSCDGEPKPLKKLSALLRG
jgi:hypothetical protein